MADANPTAPNLSCATGTADALVPSRSKLLELTSDLSRTVDVLDDLVELVCEYTAYEGQRVPLHAVMRLIEAVREDVDSACRRVQTLSVSAPPFMEPWTAEGAAFAHHLRAADPNEPAGSVRARATAARLAHEAVIASAGAAQHEPTDAAAEA